MAVTLPHEWAKIHAERAPDAPAVVFDASTLTYQELDRRADAHARRLRDAGIGEGDVVAIDAASTVETIVALLGTHRSGAVAVPRGPTTIDTAMSIDPSTYIVVPTSGTSGRPRGVILTGRNVAAAVDASQRRLGNDSQDRWLLLLPLFHVGGLAILWRSLTAGGSIELHRRFDTDTAIAALHSGAVTLASLVPTMLYRILERDSGPYEGLTAVLLGGAPARIDLVERALLAGLPVLQTYGMSEAGSQVATVERGTALRALGTTGPPLSGFVVSIEAGEILIDGPAVSPGYVGEPPRIGAHRTGDLGHFDTQGRLVVTGRADGVIMTGGENVSPSTVEAAIESIPTAGQAVVFGVADDEWGQIAVAVVEAASDDLPQIVEGVRSLIAKYEVPRRWIAVEALPLLPNGKPDRAAAQALWEATS
ncbi:MAG: AMP-binding protein [Acidimicrobiia bacterium]